MKNRGRVTLGPEPIQDIEQKHVTQRLINYRNLQMTLQIDCLPGRVNEAHPAHGSYGDSSLLALLTIANEFSHTW